MSARAGGQRAFVFVFVTVLVDSIGFGIILPVLPRLIMELTGVTVDRAAAYGGWLSFVYALMQFFCAPVLGNLSVRAASAGLRLPHHGVRAGDQLVVCWTTYRRWRRRFVHPGLRLCC
jgi:MFS family permease